MMPAGVSDLVASERGVFALLLLFVVTILVFMGRIDVPAWIEYTKWLALALIASKTVTTAVTTLKGSSTGTPP